MAADIPLPQRIISHGWWTNEGQKISKSLGNVIDPLALIEEFGVDQLRYFLMRELTFGGDGNFSRASFIRRINSDLSNNIGNLVQRTLSMIVKQCHGIIPDVSAPHYNYDPLLDKIYGSVLEIAKYIVEYNFSKALDIIIQLADSTNIYIEEHAPWNLKNTNPEKMRSVLYVLAETIRCLGIMLLPFIPESAKHILDQIGIPENERNFTTLSFYNRLAAGTSISNPQVIFPRYEE
jgi:methionyl-tRNA synthetase